jgi:hypothetical protein
MPWNEFLAAYHAHAKCKISEATLRYFEVWCNFWMLIISALAYAGYHQNKHRNFIFASVAYSEYREKADVIVRILAEHPVA